MKGNMAMRNRKTVEGVVRSFGLGMLDAFVLFKAPLRVEKRSNPSRDTKSLRKDIKRAGKRTLNERKLAYHE